MRRSLTTPDKLDLARLRESLTASEVLRLLDAIDAMLAMPTPMPGTNLVDAYARGWDSGFNAFRREARRVFGVEDG